MPYVIDTVSYRKDAHLPVGVGWAMRPGNVTPTTIVIHTTSAATPNTAFDAEARFLYNSRDVSAHFLNGKVGQIVQFLNPDLEAWHAGVALTSYANMHSIGIENHVSLGENWTLTQHDSLTWLVKQLMTHYHIASSQIETHRAIALPGPNIRKHDPTAWDDASFYAWRASLDAAPVIRTVVAGPFGAIAQQDRRPDALAARYYPPGTLIAVDDLTSNYCHTADQSGFIPVGHVIA